MQRELLAIVLLSSTACVTGPAASAPALSPGPTAGRAATSLSSNSSIITAAELQRASASDVYDAIVQLRPTFFATRGPTSLLNEPAQPIVVIIDGQLIGGISALHDLPTAITRSVRRLTAAEVFQRTGASAPSGGVEVILGRDG